MMSLEIINLFSLLFKQKYSCVIHDLFLFIFHQIVPDLNVTACETLYVLSQFKKTAANLWSWSKLRASGNHPSVKYKTLALCATLM